jgi:hypothetical protein
VAIIVQPGGGKSAEGGASMPDDRSFGHLSLAACWYVLAHSGYPAEVRWAMMRLVGSDAGRRAVSHAPQLYPEPYEWADEPDPATAQAIDEALADLDAGRSVICMSTAAFEALLDELAAEPEPKAS